VNREVTRRINLGPITLSVREQGAGPPILFLHGFPEDGDAWGQVADRLSDDFHCILPDQRGYRLSDKPAGVEAYAVDRLIADVDALADALGLVQFALSGHDWGGLVAWWYAARQPERLTHLIIANAPHPALFQRALINDPAQRAASQYVTALRQPDAEAGLPTVAPETARAMLNWYRAAPFVVPLPGEKAAMPEWISAEDFAIHVPTLVLWGMRDTALLPVLLDGLEDYVPDLTLERFKGTSHAIIREIPSQVADTIRRFIA
jgi:pimeloyl-ACP methyl ester carboxylesterase